MKDNNLKQLKLPMPTGPAEKVAAPASSAEAAMNNVPENTPLDKVLKVPAIAPEPGAYQRLVIGVRRLYIYSHEQVKSFRRMDKQPGGLASNICLSLEHTMRSAFTVMAYNPKVDREQLLRDMSIDFKMMETNIRAAYEMKLIIKDIYSHWYKEIYRLDDMVIGLAMGIQKKKRATRNPKKMKK